MVLKFSFIFSYLFFSFSAYGSWLCCGDITKVEPPKTTYTVTEVAQKALYHEAKDIAVDLVTGNVAKAKTDALSGLSYALRHCSEHPDLVARLAAEAIDELIQPEHTDKQKKALHISYFHNFFDKINLTHYPDLGMSLKNHFDNILRAGQDQLSHVALFKEALIKFERKPKPETKEIEIQTMPTNLASDLWYYVWNLSFVKSFLDLLKFEQK